MIDRRDPRQAGRGRRLGAGIAALVLAGAVGFASLPGLPAAAQEVVVTELDGSAAVGARAFVERPDITLYPGESRQGFDYGPQGGVTFAGRALFEPVARDEINYDYYPARVFIAPDGRHALVMIADPVELFGADARAYSAIVVDFVAQAPLGAALLPDGLQAIASGVTPTRVLEPRVAWGAGPTIAYLVVEHADGGRSTVAVGRDPRTAAAAVLQELMLDAGFAPREVERIRHAASRILTTGEGLHAWLDLGLAQPAARYGVSWWQVFGTLVAAEDVLSHLAAREYRRAVERLGFYTSVKLVSATSGGSIVVAAAKIGALAALPIDLALRRVYNRVQQSAVRTQLAAYYHAREAGAGHQVILAGRQVPATGDYGLYFSRLGWISEVISGVSQRYDRAPTTLTPAALFEVARLLYEAEQEARLLVDRKPQLQRDFERDLRQLQRGAAPPG